MLLDVLPVRYFDAMIGLQRCTSPLTTKIWKRVENCANLQATIKGLWCTWEVLKSEAWFWVLLLPNQNNESDKNTGHYAYDEKILYSSRRLYIIGEKTRHLIRLPILWETLYVLCVQSKVSESEEPLMTQNVRNMDQALDACQRGRRRSLRRQRQRLKRVEVNLEKAIEISDSDIWTIVEIRLQIIYAPV